jgi:IS605 OrfB family transposase
MEPRPPVPVIHIVATRRTACPVGAGLDGYHFGQFVSLDEAVDPDRVAGVDLGIIHPYAIVTDGAGLLVSGRAVRAEDYLHLADRKARTRKAAHKAPKPGQRGSRRWRKYRRAQRRAAVRHRRRVRQVHHEAAGIVVAFAVDHKVGTVLVGNPRGITSRDWGRRHNLRLRNWRRTHLVQALRDKAELAGIKVVLVDERGSSSTCPACPTAGSQAEGPPVRLSALWLSRAPGSGGCPQHRHHPRWRRGTSIAGMLVEHRRAGQVSARRDRRRHLQDRRRGSCLASGRPALAGRRSPGRHLAAASAVVRVAQAAAMAAPGEDQVALPDRANVT